MTDVSASPLTEVDPNASMDEFYDRLNQKLIGGMPELVTEDDMRPIVANLVSMRAQFLVEQDKLGRAPNPRAKKQSVPATPGVVVDADDL
jgi:hypothetical protein